MLNVKNLVSLGVSIIIASLFVATAFSSSLSESAAAPVLVQESNPSSSLLQRLVVEVVVGEVVETYIDDKGRYLFIQLSDVVDLEQWQNRLPEIKSQSEFFDFIDLRQIHNTHYIVIGLATPMFKVEETIAMSVPGQVSWEVVLAGIPEEMQSKATPPPVDLYRVAIERRLRALNLQLIGSADFVAEAYFDDQSGAFIVELPGVSKDQLEKQLPQDLPEVLGEVTIAESVEGVTQLKFLSSVQLDIVDTAVSYEEDTESVVIDIVIVKDGPPSEHAEQVLQGLRLNEDEGLELSLLTEASVTPNAYVLDNPARLMVDLIGLPPHAVEDVVVGTVLDKRLVDRIRYGSSRLGSARLELSLKPEYMAAMAQSAVPFIFDEESQIKVSLPAVERELLAGGGQQGGAVILPSVFMGANPVALTYSPELVLEESGKMAMGSVNLSAERYDSDDLMDPIPSGTSFTLLGLFTEALDRDPEFQSAKSEFTANMEAKPQALAGYLPKVSFNYQYSAVGQDVHDSSAISLGNYNYSSQNWDLTLTQPIFRMPEILKLDQAELAQQQAKLVLLSAEQELILRVATSYLKVLAGFDALELSKAEQQALLTHYQLAKRKFESGLGNRAELVEAQSRATLIEARKIEAEYRLHDARLSLKQIVGQEVEGVSGFKADFIPAPPFPAEVEPWVKAAHQQNLSLQTRRFASKISDLEVRRQRAGHLPSLDFTASVGQQDDERTLYADGRQYLTSYQAGIQVRLPIYEGGMTSSLVREASARAQQSHHKEDLEFRQTERLVRTAFLGVQASTSMLKALRDGVYARQIELETKTKGFNSGVESILSVLDSYQDYFSARRDFLQSRYDYLLNRLKLKQAVGSLSRQDLISLDTLLSKENSED